MSVLLHQLVTHLFVFPCPESCLVFALNPCLGSLAVAVSSLLAHVPVRPVVFGMLSPVALVVVYFGLSLQASVFAAVSYTHLTLPTIYSV